MRAAPAAWARTGYLVNDEDDVSTHIAVSPTEALAMIMAMVLGTLGLIGAVALIFIWSTSP